MAHQHCRLSISDAIADYAQGLLTAKGAIAYWIRNQENQEITIDPKEVRNLFKRNGQPMSREEFCIAFLILEQERAVIIDRSFTPAKVMKGEV